VFVVAEMSGNHNQSFERALALVDAAAEAGADAVKLQTYTPDTMTIDCDAPWFRVEVNEAWSGETLYGLYARAATPWEWQPRLKAHAASRGLVLFASPFDASAVDFLERMEVPLYKVASFEIGDLPLLRRVGATRKPVILSRGLASADEIEQALAELRGAGAPQVAVLHCVSAYPAEAEEMNLRTLPDIARRFGVVAGLSDHSLGTSVAVASVALGASIVEKHYTLCRADGGPDAHFSLEPDELCALVRAIRETEAALGEARYEPGEREAENVVFRRSLFAVRDIGRGESLTNENVRIIRPGYGLPPRELQRVVGRRARNDIPRGTPLHWELLEPEPRA
jgi:pseudaminic acid synthase